MDLLSLRFVYINASEEVADELVVDDTYRRVDKEEKGERKMREELLGEFFWNGCECVV